VQPNPIEVDCSVYASITIISVLITNDGWHRLSLVDVIGLIVGPVVTIFPPDVHWRSRMTLDDVAQRCSSCHPEARGNRIDPRDRRRTCSEPAGAM
jgi:hypothetical protein